MSTPVLTRHLDPTPPRPTRELTPPEHLACFRVVVDVARLANPHLAVTRLLASEAGAYAQVVGDDELQIRLAVRSGDQTERQLAEQWVRWAVHCAGIRGNVYPLDPKSSL